MFTIIKHNAQTLEIVVTNLTYSNFIKTENHNG